MECGVTYSLCGVSVRRSFAGGLQLYSDAAVGGGGPLYGERLSAAAASAEHRAAPGDTWDTPGDTRRVSRCDTPARDTAQTRNGRADNAVPVRSTHGSTVTAGTPNELVSKNRTWLLSLAYILLDGYTAFHSRLKRGYNCLHLEAGVTFHVARNT